MHDSISVRGADARPEPFKASPVRRSCAPSRRERGAVRLWRLRADRDAVAAHLHRVTGGGRGCGRQRREDRGERDDAEADEPAAADETHGETSSLTDVRLLRTRSGVITRRIIEDPV